MPFSQKDMQNAISYVSAALGVPDGIEIKEEQLRDSGILVGEDGCVPTVAEKIALVNLLKKLRLLMPG